MVILIAVLFVASLTAVAESALGGGGGHGGGEDGGYGPGGIYGIPYYAGNTNSAYATSNQPNYAGDVYDYAYAILNEVLKI